MNRVIYIVLLLLGFNAVRAQPFKFHYSNTPKVLKSNSDTMLYPFMGGVNAPQFFNIELDGDGVRDLAVFDRSPGLWGHKLLTFVWSAGRYIYAPQYEGKFPEMTEWVIFKDYNGDGKEDIFTEVARDKREQQDTTQVPYPNSLRVFINKSDASGLKFKLINNQIRDTGGWWKDFGVARPAGPVGMNKIDINGIEDLDGDGDLDIVGFNGYNFSPHFYENWTINPQGIPYSHDSMVFIYRDDCWGYMQYDVNAQRNMFKLRQSKDSLSACSYQLYAKKQKHAGSATLLIDLNNDGIKDMVYGDVSFTNLLSMINGRKQNSLHRDSMMMQDTSFPSNTTPARFIIQPAAFFLDIDNDNVNELLVTTNSARHVKNTQNVWVYENTGTNTLPVFNYQGNNFFLFNEGIDLGSRTVPVLVDIDKDGDKDMVVATSGNYEQTQDMKDRLVLYRNISSDTSKPVFMLADTNFLSIGGDTPILSMHPTFGDLNGDGKEDLLIGDAGGKLAYYINQGTGSNYSFQLQSRKFSNIMVPGYAAPQIVDLNKDGKPDLVIGNKGGTVQYFQNTGTITAPIFSSTPTIDSLGRILVNMVTKLPSVTDTAETGYATPFVCDLDKDGNYEMMVGSEAGYIYLFTGVNALPGTNFTGYNNLFSSDSSSQTVYTLNFGSRTTPFVGYLDGDAKPDLLSGNLRGGLNLFGSSKRSTGPIGVGSVGAAFPRVTVYPNPAWEQVYVGMENINEDITYEVYSEIGKLMSSGRISMYYAEQRINMPYASGIYFIVFKGDEGYRTAKRVLINR